MKEENESQRNLNKLVDYLKPHLSKYGFSYQPGLTSYASAGPFANGFFVSSKIKIGLIFRGRRFGSVNYEGAETNISHDMMFKALGKQTEQLLLYHGQDPFTSFSHSANNESAESALLADLENTILPYLEKTSLEDINSLINKARKKYMWKKKS